jgi:hypothetical protein
MFNAFFISSFCQQISPTQLANCHLHSTSKPILNSKNPELTIWNPSLFSDKIPKIETMQTGE